MGLSSSSTGCVVAVSPHWFGDPSSSLAQGPVRRPVALDPEVFPRAHAVGRTRRTDRTSTTLASPSEYDRRRAAAPVGGAARGSSHEVCGSFSTSHLSSPRGPGLPHPVCSACRVSHPRGELLLDRLPDRKGRSAPGVPYPSELFPRPEQGGLSATRYPLAVSSTRQPGRPRSTRAANASAVALRGALREEPGGGEHSAGERLSGELDFRVLLPGASPLRARSSSKESASGPMLSWVSAPIQGDPPGSATQEA